MKIVVSPMCEELLKWIGVENYIVSKFPDTIEDVDIAILLFESKTKYPSIKIKLNTFKQIKESIEILKKYFNKDINTEEIFNEYAEVNELISNISKYREPNKNINIKVYSLFLRDIVEDLGFSINDENYSYVIYPDYLKENIEENCLNLIEVPSHNFVSKNPIIRCKDRYLYILDNIK